MFGKLTNAFMALFFQLLYHQFAWTYDLVAAIVSFGKWKDWVRSITDQIDPIPTLELGFGPGHLQTHLVENGYPVFGVDFSHQMCRIAANRLETAGLSKSIAHASGTAVPFPNANFEQVIATFPSEYILQPETLSEIRRILKPGGKLVILAMATITGKSLLQRLMALIYRITGQSIDLDKHPSDKMLKPFSDHGFRPEIIQQLTENADLTFLIANLPN